MDIIFHILNGMKPRIPFPGSGTAVFKKTRWISKGTHRKRKKVSIKVKKSKKSKKVPPAGPESKTVRALPQSPPKL